MFIILAVSIIVLAGYSTVNHVSDMDDDKSDMNNHMNVMVHYATYSRMGNNLSEIMHMRWIVMKMPMSCLIWIRLRKSFLLFFRVSIISIINPCIKIDSYFTTVGIIINRYVRDRQQHLLLFTMLTFLYFHLAYSHFLFLSQ